MIVHLLRHAKTETSSTSGKDYDRKLVAKGHEQCTQLKNIISVILGAETKVYCSSAQRTRETAKLIFDSAKPISYFDELYLCGKKRLFDFICEQNSEKEILIIGHNFGVSELASYFIGKQVVMKTGGFMSIEFPDFSIGEISASTGILMSNHRCNIEY